MKTQELTFAEAKNLLKLGLCQAVQYQSCPYGNDDLYWTLVKDKIIRNYVSGGTYGPNNPQEITRKFKVFR